MKTPEQKALRALEKGPPGYSFRRIWRSICKVGSNVGDTIDETFGFTTEVKEQIFRNQERSAPTEMAQTSSKKLNIERAEALITLLQLGGMLTVSLRQACGKVLGSIYPFSLLGAIVEASEEEKASMSETK